MVLLALFDFVVELEDGAELGLVVGAELGLVAGAELGLVVEAELGLLGLERNCCRTGGWSGTTAADWWLRRLPVD
jgi:hypothetical protein